MGHPAGTCPHILGHIWTAYHMWVRVLATSQVSRPPTGTCLAASQVSIRPSTCNLTTGTCPDSLGHTFALPVMCPHRLPCVDTTYHVLTPPTTCRHRQPRVDTANHASTLPTTCRHRQPRVDTAYHTSTPPTRHSHCLPCIPTTLVCRMVA